MRNNIFKSIYHNNKYHNIDEPPKFPFIIDIELTNDCNLNCKMCSRQIMKREIGYMTIDTFDKIIEQCKDRDVGLRFIRWGEPFLHPHLLDFCKQVKDEGHPLHITTNGLVISESQMKAIVDMKVDSIIFSMQGVTEEEYTYMRNNNLWSLLMDNINLLIRIRGDRDKPYISINTTVTERDKEEDINEFKEYWKRVIGIDEVNVGRTSMARLKGTPPSNAGYIHCSEPWQKLGIDWDGKVTACCADYDNLMTIGDINKYSLYNIWNNNNILDSIRILLSYDCNKMLTLCNKCYPAYGNLSNNTSKKRK